MKTDTHPEYKVVTVRCGCGNEFQTRSTSDALHVELCNECHPFYTGKQKLVDTGGRIDRFERRYGRRKKSGGDAGTADAGTPDAGTADAGTADAGAPDAETTDPAEAEAADAETTEAE